MSEWYIQLLAESLGKQKDRNGKEVCYGRTPVVAVGTTDMHAQTQQHQEGALDKVVQFVRIEKWPVDPVIADAFPNVQKLSEISGIKMSQALELSLIHIFSTQRGASPLEIAMSFQVLSDAVSSIVL